jgi:hypothetical protein
MAGLMSGENLKSSITVCFDNLPQRKWHRHSKAGGVCIGSNTGLLVMKSITHHPAFDAATFFAGKAFARFATSIELTVMACLLIGVVDGQTLQDSGTAAPMPGLNDIVQTSTSGNQTAPDGLNYYTDNQTGHATGEPGQTFTTGTNSAG